jgi:hypothetical protein
MANPAYFYVDLQLQGGSKIKNARIEAFASAPGSPTQGMVYYDTTLGRFGYYTGTQWLYAGRVDSLSTTTPAVTIGGTASAPTIDVALADSTNAGLLSSAHYDLLNGATNVDTPETLVKRDVDGSFSSDRVLITSASTEWGNTDAVTKQYVDGLVDMSLLTPEAYTVPGTGASYPTTFSGAAIVKGASFRIANNGTLSNGTDTADDEVVNTEDLLIALVDNPGTTRANWQVLESNRDQATETAKGVARIATNAEGLAGTDNENIMTALRVQEKLDDFLSDDKYSADVILDGAIATTVTHGLNTTDYVVSVRNASGKNITGGVDIATVNANSLTVDANTPMTVRISIRRA